jgi:fermentation-respiration switch protein FrsA (DUF1100 family)
MTSDDLNKTDPEFSKSSALSTSDNDSPVPIDRCAARTNVDSALDSPELLEAVEAEGHGAETTKTRRSAKDSRQGESNARKKKARRRPPRSRAARITISFVQIVVVTYVALLIALVCLETRLVYPGAYFGDVDGTQNYPSGKASGIERVEYKSEDGTPLKGRLVERTGAKNYLLFFHGNGSKARWLDVWGKLLSDEFDANVLLAEYRGYEDDATPSESAVISDCRSARRFLCKRYQCQPDDVILYGRSLGGGCAVALASQGGAKALVLERTFDRLVDVAGDKYPYVPVSMLMRNRYDSIAKLTAYDGPLVMLHGSNDKLIPIEHAQRLYDSARCDDKHWIEVPDLGHNDPLASSDLQQIVQAVSQFTTDTTPSTGGLDPVDEAWQAADDSNE